MSSLARGLCVLTPLTSDERERVTADCGTATWWTLRDSCDSTVDAYLANPGQPLELHVQPEQQDFVAEYLARSLRERVLEQCEGCA